MGSTKFIKNKSNIAMSTEIEDIRLTSILDIGFAEGFQITSETHSHTFFELFITIGGRLCLESLHGDTVMMNEGSFCLIRPSVYHNTKVFTDDAKKLAIRFQFERICGSSAELSLYERVSSTLDTLEPISVFHDCRELCAAFCELRNEILYPSIASDTCAAALLTRLYICFFRSLFDGEHESHAFNNGTFNLATERKLKIEEYFFSHFKERITEDDMASEMNLSKRQLNRVLQSIYGVGFRRHLIDIRLHRAAQLLIETTLSIDEICAEIGYTSISGFYSAFSQSFGISAGQYRKKFRK